MRYQTHSRNSEVLLHAFIPWGAVLFFILVFPHMKTAFFDTFDFFDTFFNVARVVSMLITIVLYVITGHHANACVGILVAFEAFLAFSTVINDESIVPFASTYALALGVYLLIDLYSDSPGTIVGVLLFVGELMVYSNLFAMILMPDGLYISKLLGYYHNWILGYKNQFLPFFICFTTIAFLEIKNNPKSLRPKLLIGAMVISLLLANSATSLIVIIFFLVAMGLIRTRIESFINPFVLIAIIILLFIVTVLMGSFEEFRGIIASVLNRDMTLSGRTLIWSAVFKAIAERPFLGWGVMSDEAHIALIEHAEASSSHDFYLELVLSGGVIALILFLLFIGMIYFRLEKHKDLYASKLFMISIFCLGVAYLTEAYSNPILFALFALAANVDKFAYLGKYKRRKQALEEKIDESDAKRRNSLLPGVFRT